MDGDPLRLLIADDHPLFRKGMRTMLGAVPDFALVGEAETAQAAVERSLALQPDVVLMDLQMPGGSGIEATREIVAASPTTSSAGSGPSPAASHRSIRARRASCSTPGGRLLTYPTSRRASGRCSGWCGRGWPTSRSPGAWASPSGP